ncbi:MAG: hypothetical protein AAB428_00560 [Patescibacteria group bacterium]
MLKSNGYSINSFPSKTLTEERYAAVIEHIKEMYLWFAPDSTEEGMRKRIYQHPEAYIDLLMHDESGECRGFSIYYAEQFEGFQVMFRGGTIVKDRSHGLYKALLHHSIDQSKLDFVVAMTQNPRVYETLRSFSPTGIAYPSTNGVFSETIKRITHKFCKVPDINPETMIVSGIYKTIRKENDFRGARDPEVMEFFAKNLAENDGFFVVVPLS